MKKDKKKLKKQGIDVDKLEQKNEEVSVEQAVKTTEVAVTTPEPSKEEVLLTQIRDLLAGKFVAQTPNPQVATESASVDIAETVGVKEPKN